jgi:putative transposase
MVLMATNRLWVADIDCVRLAEESVYLAVLLNAFSRRVIGWALASHLRASPAPSPALLAASVSNQPKSGSWVIAGAGWFGGNGWHEQRTERSGGSPAG